MVFITIVTGAYKPTNITGGPHIVGFHRIWNISSDLVAYGPMVKYRRSDIWKQRRKLHFRGQRWVDPNGNHIFLLHILNIRGTLIFLHWSEPKTAKSWAFYPDWRSTQHQLVGGWPTPLKNDGVRQWEGWHPIYEMESDKIPWFQTTNQSIYIYIYHYTRIIHIFHISVSYYPTISNIYIYSILSRFWWQELSL